uniref:Uncharacterized protein n=1 Tax=Astatotilapia calliptera TaxID=8154 RepID=A0A3P8NGA6_ASTCA
LSCRTHCRARWCHVACNSQLKCKACSLSLHNRPSSALQGMAFTLEERLQLGIHGLLPPCFLSQDVQVLRVMKSYETRTNPLDK